MAVIQPQKIGRFQIIELLGQGGKGAVYLAEDTHLRRRVAIKTLRVDDAEDRGKRVRTLLDEARIVSRLQHPNIVALYDAGEDAGIPYWVFEYVEGSDLARLMKQQGALPVRRAVEITLGILAAIGYAHRQQVVHCDLKPSNILLDNSDIPQVMDFGIAKPIVIGLDSDAAFLGTPAYMAPEYITDRVFTLSSDIFSVGMVLYEMLTGAVAVDGDDVQQMLHQMVNAPFSPPSHRNAEVDEQLDDVVLKALAKRPDERYQSAEEMAMALRAFLQPAEDAPGMATVINYKQATLDFLLRRMRHKSDFPALSHTISTINKIVSSEQEGVAGLSNSILKDFALTNKLLKLVNTAYYGHFGGTISTVSRAVVILGFDAIRNVAITLMLFDHLQNKAQASQLKDDIVASYFSGIIAREMVFRAGIKDAEEAFICAMFHNLGRLLVAFYFHEEMVEIDKLIQQKGLGELVASTKVLGLSYEDLAVGVARAWHFPEKIVYSMRRLGEGQVRRPLTEEERLRVLSGLANELCYLARTTRPQEKEEKLRGLASRFSKSMSLSEKILTTVTEDSIKELARESGILNFDVTQSGFFAKASGWVMLAEIGGACSASRGNGDGTVSLADDAEVADEVDCIAPDAQAVLNAGIQDITNTLVDDYQLNDVLRIILETMYRGIGFSRVMLCVRDVRQNAMVARFGFGQDIDRITKQFKFPMSYTPDVFHAAMSQGVDILIQNVDADNIKERIPSWYRHLVPSQSFIIFPVLVDKKPIGMFYGDKDVAGELAIQTKELNLLKTLRNQAVLAIKQKY